MLEGAPASIAASRFARTPLGRPGPHTFTPAPWQNCRINS